MMSPHLLALGCAAATLAVAAPMARAADLVVAAPAPLERLADTAFAAPFAAATHRATSVVPLTPPPAPAPVPATASAQPAAAAASPHPAAPPALGPGADVVLIDGQTLLAGCASGALRKLDWSAIGGRDRLLPQAGTECGQGAVLRGMVLAWSRDKFSGAPNWADFWDVAKVPGKRGLWRGARGNLEFALIADGVAPSDVYATLRDKAGVERAFRKLDQLKPYVVWWTKEDEAPRLLASGDVLMTSAPAEGVLAAAKGTSGVAPHDFAVQWTGALLSYENWALPAAAAHLDAAQKFLGFASDPKQQKGLAAFTGFGSAVTDGTEGLGAAEKANSPSTQANFSAGLLVDEAFWRDNGQKLEAAYEAWLAKP